jgi:hypothetical protein
VCASSGTGYGPCNCGSGSADSGSDTTLSAQESGADAADATTGESGLADSGAETSPSPPEAGGDAAADVADVFIPNDGPARVSGSVQKGPFVLGSSISLSAIDGTGTPTGQVFNTQTTDDLGDFAVTFTYRGNVDVAAQGYYYDEVTGGLSTAPIVLRALYAISNGGPQSAYVNIRTHLAHDRALALMGDAGMSLTSAEAQAEAELVAALGIGGGFQPGGTGIASNELGGDNDQNAYLFALSAILVQAAREQAGDGGSVDATLQQLINTIAVDLSATGQLPTTLTSQIRTAEQDLDVDLTMDFFATRLAATGSSATIPDLNRAVDSDGDGYRNRIDTCPLGTNQNQTQVPSGVLCKVTRHTTFLPSGAGPTGASFAFVGDFEDAGHAGILGSGLEGQGTQNILPGDGNGRFGSPATTSIPLSPVMVYDVDQNGTLDLAGATAWASGDGRGHFSSAGSFPAPTVASDGGTLPANLGFGGIALADFNGDHLVDIARLHYVSYDPFYGTGPPTYAALVVSLATAAGVFGPAVSMSIVGAGIDYTGGTLLAGDMNNDGHVDLVTVGGDSTTVAATFLGDGAGGFRAATSTGFAFSSFGTQPAYGVALTDFDGDGDLDVAIARRLGTVQVAFGDGSGGFTSDASTSLATTMLSNDAYLVAGDFNSDGKGDLFAHDFGSGNAYVLMSNGRAFASPQRIHSSFISDKGWVPASLSTGDLNGDGTPDVVMVSQDANGTWSIQSYVMNVLF